MADPDGIGAVIKWDESWPPRRAPPSDASNSSSQVRPVKLEGLADAYHRRHNLENGHRARKVAGAWIDCSAPTTVSTDSGHHSPETLALLAFKLNLSPSAKGTYLPLKRRRLHTDRTAMRPINTLLEHRFTTLLTCLRL